MLKLTGRTSQSAVYVSLAAIDVIEASIMGDCTIWANGRSYFVTESAEQVIAMFEAAMEDDDPDATRQ